ncbi:unnamed protein product, partial [Vitis vinifera]
MSVLNLLFLSRSLSSLPTRFANYISFNDAFFTNNKFANLSLLFIITVVVSVPSNHYIYHPCNSPATQTHPQPQQWSSTTSSLYHIQCKADQLLA